MPNSPRRSSGCCCCCKLLCCLIQLAIYLGIVVFIYWLIFHPRLPRASVNEVQLLSFNLTDNSTALHYNLTVGLAIRNPNRRVGIYCDSLDAAVFYHGAQLESASLPAFYQHHKNTTALRPTFGGRATDVGSVAAFYGTDRSQGFYNFEVKLDLRVRMKLLFVKIGHFNPKFDCKARVPVPQDGGMPVNFETWECDR